METIYLLPVVDYDLIFDSNPKAKERFAQMYRERMRMAATLNYIPDSLETLMAIEYSDKKMLMRYNPSFYHAAIALCAEFISDMIEIAKELADQYIGEGKEGWEEIRDQLETATSANDLILSGYYGFNYESARGEFASCLVEYYLS